VLAISSLEKTALTAGHRTTSVSGSCSLKPPMHDTKMDELKIFVSQSLSSTLETVKTKRKII
jgi:hypothetical protein